jgi:cytochrome P450
MTESGTLSLFHLLEPAVLADPYPLYARLRTEAPVLWDPYLHAWVVTRYRDVSTVLTRFSANRTPTPGKLAELGMQRLGPIAEVMVRQMLFLDPPQHGRVRGLAAAAFTPRRIEVLREHVREITENLVAGVVARGEMDLMAELANPLPAIVTAEMLGVPVADHELLKGWSADFAEMLGNFQHNPGRTDAVLRSVGEMTEYFRAAVRREATRPTEGLINALTTAEVGGDRFSEDEVVANIIVTMVGGQETTTNLIGNGMLTLLRHRDRMARLREAAVAADPAGGTELIADAVEELLRFESPSQHTARIAPADTEIGGRLIEQGQAVIAVMGAANRDPERFPDPDRLDLARADNRHLAFGWAAHFCFGAPLARMEAYAAFTTMLRELPDLELAEETVRWRPNLGLRGLEQLRVRWRR